jgi:hypothetical protein
MEWYIGLDAHASSCKLHAGDRGSEREAPGLARGGAGSHRGTQDPGITSLDEALRPACRRFTLGEDVLFDLDLRSPSA